jgi:CheY-like chemotaxis protein
MAERVNLTGIKGFNVNINGMSDTQYNTFLSDINHFVDSVPAHTRNLRTHLAAGEIPALVRTLNAVCDALFRISANEISAKFREIIQTLPNTGGEDAEHFTEEFITEVSALSIDVQMALHGNPPSAARVSQSGKPVILAVDNAMMFLNTLRRLLADAPYDLHCVTSGPEALAFLERTQPSIILLDIEMPDMDGYELTLKIKQRGQHAPILFITANSDREYVDRAVKVGAVGLLMKPLRMHQLLKKLQEFI